MERTQIHEQIIELADKVQHLNNNLKQSSRIHPVEIDLLKLYCRELVKLTDELGTSLGQAAPQAPAATPNIVFKPVEVSIPEVEVKAEMPQPLKEQESSSRPEPVNHIEEEKPIEQKHLFNLEPEILAKSEGHEKHMRIVMTPYSEPEVKEDKEGRENKKEEATEQEVPESHVNTATETIIPTEEPPLPRHQVSMQKPPIEQDEDKRLNERFTPANELLHTLKKQADARKLREMMDLGEKYLYVKELFGDDVDLFDRALRYLDQLNSLEEADKFLGKEIMSRHSWLGKDKIAAQFYALLERKFGN